MNMIAQQDNLVLREVERADAPFILKLYSSEAFRRGIGDRGVETLDDAIAYIEANFAKSYREHGFGMWLLEVDQQPAGVCGLVQRSYLDAPDLGFALLPEFFGRGIARKAARLTLTYVEQQQRHAKLFAITSATNQRSQALLLDIGFTQTESVREPLTGASLTTFYWLAPRAKVSS